MEHSLMEIWETMGFLARLVAVTLVGMGVISLGISLERLWVLKSSESLSSLFAQKSKPLVDDAEVGRLLDLSKGKEFEKAPLAKLTRFGLETFDRYEDTDQALDFTRRDLERRLEVLAAQARRGMGFLASVGSTAPFIGLFGTVIGIITAFQGIAASGGGGLDAVSAGIAEALIVTAVGLVVAIVSVLIFNYLSGRFDKLDMNMNHAAGELVDFLEARGGRSA